MVMGGYIKFLYTSKILGGSLPSFFTILFNRNCGLKHEVGLLRLQEKNLEKI